MRFENAYHPGIQIASIPIKHSIGLFITISTTIVFLWGVSFAIYYVLTAWAAGVLVAYALRRHRRLHPPEPPLELHLN